MAIEKGTIYVDTRDGQEMIVTSYEELPGGSVVEFLEIKPLGKFAVFEADELAEYGIQPKFEKDE